MFEPSRFGRLLSWRDFTYNERLANYVFWREIGRRMNIHDIPDTLEAFEQFNQAYERDHFQYAETNHQVAEGIGAGLSALVSAATASDRTAGHLCPDG